MRLPGATTDELTAAHRPGRTRGGSRRSTPFSWFVLGCAAFGAAATLVATRHGPGMSPDSVSYFAAARNLVAGRGYADFTGQPLTTFPPGLPVLLAAGDRLGMSLATASRLLNAACFAGIVLVAAVLLRRHTTIVQTGAIALIAASTTLLHLAENVWSEPAFTLLLLAMVVVLEDAAGPPDAPVWKAAVAGGLTGVAFLVRYAATPLLVAGVLVVLVRPAATPVAERAKRALVFGGGALVLPALWLLRNASVHGPFLLGPRVSSPDGWWSFAQAFASSIAAIAFPRGVPQAAAIAVAGALVVLLAAARLLPVPGRRGPFATGPSLGPLVVVLVTYGAFVMASAKIAGSSMDTRIVAPMYVPALVVVAALVDRSMRRLREAPDLVWSAIGRGVIAAILVAYLSLSAASFVESARLDGRSPRGYASQTRRASALAHSVRALGSRAVVASNNPWELYAAVEREPILVSPGRLLPQFSLVPSSIDDLADAACSGDVYLAWYDSRSGWSDSPTQLERALRLDPIQTVSDGVLYAVHPRSSADPCPAVPRTDSVPSTSRALSGPRRSHPARWLPS